MDTISYTKEVFTEVISNGQFTKWILNLESTKYDVDTSLFSAYRLNNHYIDHYYDFNLKLLNLNYLTLILYKHNFKPVTNFDSLNQATKNLYEYLLNGKDCYDTFYKLLWNEVDGKIFFNEFRLVEFCKNRNIILTNVDTKSLTYHFLLHISKNSNTQQLENSDMISYKNEAFTTKVKPMKKYNGTRFETRNFYDGRDLTECTEEDLLYMMNSLYFNIGTTNELIEKFGSKKLKKQVKHMEEDLEKLKEYFEGME